MVALADELLDRTDAVEDVMWHTMQEFAACYRQLSDGVAFAADLLADHCRRFCTLYISLEEIDATFRIKPKLHLMQELCEMSLPTCPAKHWTYRDEDRGGSLARLAQRRGGPKTPFSIGKTTLTKFRGNFRLPNFIQ